MDSTVATLKRMVEEVQGEATVWDVGGDAQSVQINTGGAAE